MAQCVAAARMSAGAAARRACRRLLARRRRWRNNLNRRGAALTWRRRHAEAASAVETAWRMVSRRSRVVSQPSWQEARGVAACRNVRRGDGDMWRAESDRQW